MNAMPQPQLPSDPSQPQLQVVQPPPPTKPRVRFGPIIRDVAIVWVLTAIGGFVAGVAGGKHSDPTRGQIALVVSNFFLGTVAFTISGCLAPRPRWNHLAYVALGAWLTSLINVIFFHVTVPQWMFSALFMGIIMGLGGAVSYLFKKDR
ncbi:MAG TPA: hypothetical protein VK850_16175 [Candidatus Binatia bacterium]|nr:hypothetical protein [Candidatus Binatia bacterium]